MLASCNASNDCRIAAMPVSTSRMTQRRARETLATTGFSDSNRTATSRSLHAALGAAALLLIAAAPPDPERIRFVIDGDTFVLESGERIRIAGIDAPETRTGQAKCRREIVAGKAATARAKALLEGRNVTLDRVGRSYGRTVSRVRLDGRDVAGELVRIGAARWWPRGRPGPDWCANR